MHVDNPVLLFSMVLVGMNKTELPLGLERLKRYIQEIDWRPLRTFIGQWCGSKAKPTDLDCSALIMSAGFCSSMVIFSPTTKQTEVRFPTAAAHPVTKNWELPACRAPFIVFSTK